MLKKALAFGLIFGSAITCAAAPHSSQSNEAVPYWFGDVLNQAKAQGCSENWKDYYWAKKLPPSRLKIGCRGDGELIVAPDVVALDTQVARYSATFPFDDVLSPNINRNGPYFRIIYYTAELSNARLQATAEKSKNIDPVPLSGTDLLIIYARGFSFCAVPKSVLELKDWPLTTPWVCGTDTGHEKIITSMSFAVDKHTRALIETPSGIPPYVDISMFHAQILNFIKSVTSK